MLVTERSRTPLRSALSGERAPEIVLGIGVLVVGVVAAILALRVTYTALDEAVYKGSAVNYTNGLPGTLFTDVYARGTARLWPLIISPLFAVFDADVAVRLTRVLNALLMASAAIPLYLMARRLVQNRWWAVAGALGSILVPWLTLTSTIFTEPISYALVAWTVLLMIRALERPTWRLDLGILVLLGALVTIRMQFFSFAPVWLATVLVAEWRRQGPPGVRAVPGYLKAAFRRYPFLLGGTALLIAALLVLFVSGALGERIRGLLGSYNGIRERGTLPAGVGQAFFYELATLSLGVGLVPAMLALAWFPRALGSREGTGAARFAWIVVPQMAVLFAITIYAQGGWLGPNSEERYFLYAVPFLWLGAVIALDGRSVRPGAVFAAGTVVAAALFLVPLDVYVVGERAFLAPVTLIVAALWPDVQSWLAGAVDIPQRADFLGVLALLLALVAVAAAARRRWRAISVGFALALQLTLLVVAFAFAQGEFERVGGLTGSGGPGYASFEQLGWVDRATPGRSAVAWVVNDPAGQPVPGAQRFAFFWNDEIRSTFVVPDLGLPGLDFTLGGLPGTAATVADDLTLQPEPRVPRYLVSYRDSPFLQIAGRDIGGSADGAFVLREPERPPRATWVARGLDGDAHIQRAIALRAAGGHRVTFVFDAPAFDTPSWVRLDLGGEKRELDVVTGRRTTTTFDLCDERGAVAGELAPGGPVRIPDGRYSAGILRAVKLERC